ncbi:MAG: sensor histidine kinase [Leptospirillia bacterium]
MGDYEKINTEGLADQLRALKRRAGETAAKSESEHLLHDLQVHQIELEMQNRELCEAQQELEASRDRYADLYDFSPVSYATFDARGVIREINLTGASLLGQHRSQVLGKPFSMWLSGEDILAFFRHLKNAFDTRDKTVTELHLKGAGGAMLDLRLESTVMETPSAKPAQLRTALLDITEQRRAEQWVRQRQAEICHVDRLSTMGEMATGIAHELNQPLFAIINFTHACIEQLNQQSPGDGRDKKLRQRLEQVAEQAERAGNIIGQMRIFVNKGSTRREPLDINQRISDAIALIQPLIHQQGHVELRFDQGRNVPEVMGNPVQIEQVIVNLVKNGVEASAERPDGTVIIATRPGTDGGVEVSVQDNGHGLSQAEADQLFHPFFTTKPDGMGMGLAICRTIVESHGGRIQAAPGEGAGTTFRFTLPPSEVGP